ncbi:acyl-ACP thioesterase domain-containing protein [Lachnospiraceae bacterium 50-23]|nr:acyl-[acyl-carrier-protein] thioesterase [Dorea sp.]
MQKNHEYTFESRVRFSEVDHTKKMTLPGIINYFQDCSIFQSESLGLGVDYLAERRKAWVLSAWQVEVLRYPEIAEAVSVHTWATNFKGMLGERNFCMRDQAGGRIACANSVWVYMDLEKGRPTRPPEEEISRYGTGEPLDMGQVSRKIMLPDRMEAKAPFAVKRYHIDTNEHVNNCQYVQMAMELMEDETVVHHLRAEYKKSAVYGDMIIPRAGSDAGRTVIELCGRDGSPYAVVEFR